MLLLLLPHTMLLLLLPHTMLLLLLPMWGLHTRYSTSC
jgi:hypothetical protein